VRAPHLADFEHDFLYTPRGAGIGPRCDLSGRGDFQRVLVVGVGSGVEVDAVWRRAIKAESVVAVDLEASTIWETMPETAFAVTDVSRLAIRAGSVDLVCSHSVLEHVVDLQSFLSEAHRVLRPSGVLYALFGPLWHTHGGSHVGDLAYDHLLLPPEHVLERARTMGNGWEWWLERGLFNGLRLEDYLRMIEQRFRVVRLVLAGSPAGERFRDDNPVTWCRLTREHSERDLLVRLVSVVAERRD
jgi:SAM-dependent methyltransferase